MYIAYEVMISCKGPFSTISYVFFYYLENQFYVFQTLPVVVYILGSVLAMSQHWCHRLSRCLCEHPTFHHLKNNSKSHKKHHWQCGINLAIDIPNDNRKIHKLALLLFIIGYLQCLFEYIGHIAGMLQF